MVKKRIIILMLLTSFQIVHPMETDPSSTALAAIKKRVAFDTTEIPPAADEEEIIKDFVNKVVQPHKKAKVDKGDKPKALEKDQGPSDYYKYQCDQCNAAPYAYSSGLYQHKRSTHQSNPEIRRPFICNLRTLLGEHCGKRFAQKGHLVTHQTSSKHSVEKAYKCSHANCSHHIDGFYRKCDLTAHIKAAHNNQGFQCPHCTREPFARESNLITHIRTHTGAKPFACTLPGCAKTFSRQDVLKNHQKICACNIVIGLRNPTNINGNDGDDNDDDRDDNKDS